jgi:hypothetical protein
MRGREEAEGMGGCEGIDVKVDSGFWEISSYIVPLEDRERIKVYVIKNKKKGKKMMPMFRSS